jgi:hypothetical protein
MSNVLASQSNEARQAVTGIFDEGAPVLVEVRFPGMATSPDWYLLEEEDQFEQLLEKLAPGTELHVSSVYDLKNAKGEIRLKK